MMMFKQRKKSLQQFLREASDKQRKKQEMENYLIGQILERKPELRNTTARMLRLKNIGYGENAGPPVKGIDKFYPLTIHQQQIKL